MSQKEPRPLPEPEVFTAIEAAVFLATNVDEITRMLRAGELRGWRTNGGAKRRGDWRVWRAECLRWIKRQQDMHELTQLGYTSHQEQAQLDARLVQSRDPLQLLRAVGAEYRAAGDEGAQ